MTHLGYIKRMTSDNFKSQHRGGKGIKGMQTIEEDYIEVNDNPPNRQIIGTTARAIAKTEGMKYANDYQVYVAALEERGILTEELKPYFADGEKNPNVAEVVQLMANVYEYLMQNV